ncbi:hypothetical protein [Nonomuraea dietziae]|uniref:hypothetical protein n=1 Tax=Nonomuraea dietziae TaxID=65515 RepID=UPI00342EAD1C
MFINTGGPPVGVPFMDARALLATDPARGVWGAAEPPGPRVRPRPAEPVEVITVRLVLLLPDPA